MKFVQSPEFASRLDFPKLLNFRHMDGSSGVEVGVFRGEFSEHMLKNWNCKWWHIVDTWNCQTLNGDMHSRDIDLAWTIQRLLPWCDKIRHLRMDSVEAASYVSGQPCFVYLDGLHTYKQVKADIAAWFPKISNNGILAGHDFSPECPGVIQAVTEFAEEQGVPIVYLGHQRCYKDWLIYKTQPTSLLQDWTEYDT